MEDLKQLRLDLDGISHLILGLTPYIDSGGIGISVELYDSNKSIILGKAWIGKLMGELGIPSPYINDGNRNTVGDIEPIDAQSSPDPRGTVIQTFLSDNKNIWSNKNHVQRVDALRGVIDWTLDKFIKGYADNQSITISIIFQHITEAKLWLGFELGRIRDEEQAKLDKEIKHQEERQKEIENGAAIS